jgi:hypothetical protein
MEVGVAPVREKIALAVRLRVAEGPKSANGAVTSPPPLMFNVAPVVLPAGEIPWVTIVDPVTAEMVADGDAKLANCTVPTVTSGVAVVFAVAENVAPVPKKRTCLVVS